MKKIVLATLFLFVCINVFSQSKIPESIHVRSYTNSNGLSQNSVNDIEQDSKGFLWIATSYGLNKYDGRTFKTFYNIQDDSTSIPSNFINDIVFDSTGNPWISTDAGLAMLDRNREIFTLFQPPQIFRKDYDINFISGLIYDHNYKCIWTANSGFGLYKFDIETNDYSRFDFLPDSLNDDNSNHVWEVYIDKNNKLWVGTGAGVYVLDKDRNLQAHYSADKEQENFLTYREVTGFLESDTYMWIATTNGLNRLNTTTGKIKHYYFFEKFKNSNWISGIAEDREGKLWLPTKEKGVVVFDPSTGDYKKFQYNYEVNDGLTDNELLSVEVDYTGIVWIGTLNSGLNKVETYKEDFSLFQINPQNSNSLPSNNVFSINITKDEIFFGTFRKGLSVYNRNSKKFTNYQYERSNNNSINSNFISDIEKDDDGNIWLATTFGLALKRKNKTEFHRYEYDSTKNSLISSYVLDIKKDDKGNLWAATYSGISRYNIKSNTFYNHILDEDNPSSLSNQIVALEYNEDKLWIGTMDGLSFYSYEEDKFIKDYDKKVFKQKLPAIYFLLLDSENDLWIATEYGIYIYDFDYSQLKRITVEDGLSNNLVVSIIEDKNHNMWLGTYNGLTLYERETGSLKIFKKQDGLPDNEFNPGVFKDAEGKLYFTTIGGVVYFLPDDIKLNVYPPKVIVSEASIHTNEDLSRKGVIGKSVGNNFIAIEPDTLLLDYGQATITLTFSSLHFTSPELNQYEYKMEGMDRGWVHLENDNRVSYNKLSPGEYKFMVRGSNSHAAWSENPAILFIKVYPPIWQTSWFRVVVMLSIVLGSFTIYRLRTKRLINRALELENIVNERTQELREINATKDKFFSIISHDLKNPFVSLMGSSDLLLKKRDELSDSDQEILIQDIATSSRSTYELLENLLQWSKSQQGLLEISPTDFDLVTLINELMIILNPLAEKKNIDLELNIPEEMKVRSDKNILTSVMSNLITNAIKFSHKGETVTVQARNKDEQVIISIIDRGVGISKDEITDLFKIEKMKTKPGTNKEKGSGLGLILCKEFIERSGGQIWAESTEGVGSKFEFSIPRYFSK